jgi:protein phosphatase
VLVGPAGSGKSTFALRHFAAQAVMSADWFRKVVSDDESDQSATPQAFAILRFIAARRLRRGRLTVIDATNVRRRDRLALLRVAERFRRPAYAIVFELPLAVCLELNARRSVRQVDDDVVRMQWLEMPRPPSVLLEEGFREVHVLHSLAEIDALTVTR